MTPPDDRPDIGERMADIRDRVRSAILVPVPNVDAVIGEWRQRYDPVAPVGVPPHVSLLVPWIPPDLLSAATFAELDDELAEVKSFEFDLVRVDRFDERVLWLAPEPSGPFVDMTYRLSERFSLPPWEGLFDRVVPHLTVAHAGEGVELQVVAEEVEVLLPVRCRAEEVWVMIAGGTTWKLAHRHRLLG